MQRWTTRFIFRYADSYHHIFNFLFVKSLPNAFELFGVDFLVVHEDELLQVKLLELNAEPAIELTGPRLKWILDDLFMSIRQMCIDPYFRGESLDGWLTGDTREHFIKCLGREVYGKRC
jgi:tubulin---tyrosine ligase